MRLTNLITPEMTFSVAASVTAGYVFNREMKSLAVGEGNLTHWEAHQGFEAPLQAAHYDDVEMPYYKFAIDGDLPAEFTVFSDRLKSDIKPEPTLGKDEFAQYFFERFASLFDGHEHILCIQALRLSRQQQLHQAKLLKTQAHRNSMADGLPVRYSDKRKVR